MPTFSTETYVKRRADLKKKLNSGILLFLGNEESPINCRENCYPFRQDSNFLYFFGIDQPGVAAIIDVDNDEGIIFGDELSIDDIVWTGPQPTISEQANEVGVKQVQPFREIENYLQKADQSGNKIHYLPPYRSLNQIRLSEWLNQSASEITNRTSQDFINSVIALRTYKSAEEIEEMAKAVNISRKLHLQAREMCRSGVMESRISAALHKIVIGEGGQFAYPPIITINGQTLHNHYYGNTLEKGQMLLVDAGAEAPSHYAGDITRTFPVEGKFTDRQREVYATVLKAENNAINNCKPGITYKEVHERAMMDLAEGLNGMGIMKGDLAEAVALGAHAMFCPHGLGHMIGLDVHDMEDLGEDAVGYSHEVKRNDQFGTKSLRLGRKLEEGFVFTVEPGIYFIPELIDMWQAEKKFDEFIDYNTLALFRSIGGVRIEDNVFIADTGSQVIGEPIPKAIDEVEF